MPFPIAALSSITGAAGGFNDMMAQQFQNRESRQWSERMYQRQFDDNVRFWNMQNSYNSPEMQMQRFRAAGLNPNLAYSQGNPGNAVAIQTPQVQRPEFKSSDPGRAISDMGPNTLNAMYNLETTVLQNDNLRAQNDVLKQERLLKEAQTRQVDVSGRMGEFDLGYKTEFRDINADALREKVRQMKVGTDLSLNEDARRATLNASHLKEAMERMAKSRIERARTFQETMRTKKQIELMELDKGLKELDLKLRNMGVNPNSPTWQLLIAKYLSGMFGESGGSDPSEYGGMN